VAWLWRGNEQISLIGDRHNVRRHDTLYEELYPEVQLRVLALLVRAWAANAKALQRSGLFCCAGRNITRPNAAEFVKPRCVRIFVRKVAFQAGAVAFSVHISPSPRVGATVPDKRGRAVDDAGNGRSPARGTSHCWS
jgi:hypothetical protein